MFTKTGHKLLILMTAALLIAFSGCSDGGSSGGQAFSSFPDDSVLAEFGLAGLAPPVGCTFSRGWSFVDNEGKGLILQWKGSDEPKTTAYSLVVKDVLGGISPTPYSDSRETAYIWSLGNRTIGLDIVKSNYTEYGHTFSVGDMNLTVDIPF